MVYTQKMEDQREREDRMDKYRFDDAYENVYKLAEDGYWFYCTYIACGITAKMSDSKKLRKVVGDSV